MVFTQRRKDAKRLTCYQSFKVYDYLSPLEIFRIKIFVNPVVAHYLEHIILRLGETDLGDEDPGIFRLAAIEPAGGVVLAAVVAGRDGFVKAAEFAFQIRYICAR